MALIVPASKGGSVGVGSAVGVAVAALPASVVLAGPGLCVGSGFGAPEGEVVVGLGPARSGSFGRGVAVAGASAGRLGAALEAGSGAGNGRD